MPDSIIPHLQRQIERVRLLHDEDLSAGFGRVYLPNALEKKYPNAASELIWQYVFPTSKRSLDPRAITPSPISALEMGEGRDGGTPSPISAREMGDGRDGGRHPSPPKRI